MSLILDTDTHTFIAKDAAELAYQLIDRLDVRPDDDALAYLAAAVLGCDVLGVIITRAM